MEEFRLYVVDFEEYNTTYITDQKNRIHLQGSDPPENIGGSRLLMNYRHDIVILGNNRARGDFLRKGDSIAIICNVGGLDEIVFSDLYSNRSKVIEATKLQQDDAYRIFERSSQVNFAYNSRLSEIIQDYEERLEVLKKEHQETIDNVAVPTIRDVFEEIESSRKS